MNKKIGIWGLGIVGTSAVRYFHAKGADIQVLDRRMPSADERAFLAAHNAAFFGQENLLQFLEHNDAILPSCGIDLRPYEQFAHKWLSELDLFAQECTKPIIAITGSVGKTTVTHLLSTLLAANNKKIFTGGNIGVGLLESIAQANAADIVVLEASSFQLERCRSFAPAVAICTNIHANHLDRHGSMQAYVQAKLNILTHQNKQDNILFPLAQFDLIPQSICAARPICFFTVEIPHESDLKKLGDFHTLYFLHNSKLMMSYQTKTTQIIDFKAIPAVTYAQNIVILAATLHMLGVSLETFTATLQMQEIPEHRLEKVATINSVDFYNDSKATIPESTLAAIDKIKDRPIVLFLGGVSKGIDRSELVKILSCKVRFIYCFGKEAEQLKTFCDAYNIPASACATLDDAFTTLPALMQPQDQVLFSPSGASFDLFADYKERGEYFKKLVKGLKNRL